MIGVELDYRVPAEDLRPYVTLSCHVRADSPDLGDPEHADNGAREADFSHAIEAWLAGAASPMLDDLVALTGLSPRQIERRCKALYGVPPKLLAREYRALRAAVALATGKSIGDVLISDGFYDQSHLIREVKHFTGLTPRQIQTEPGLLGRLTFSEHTALDGQISPVISAS